MQKAYKFLLAGLAIGLVVAAVGTYALTSGNNSNNNSNGLALDCSECHAEGHGSVIAPDVNVNGTIMLSGDVPQDKFVVVDSIFDLPQRDISTLESQYDGGVPSRGVPVLEFLRAHNVSDFDRLILYADDFKLVLTRDQVTDDTVFVPIDYSVRVLAPNMPISTWLKGIRTIVVVDESASDAVTINGKSMTFGQMIENGMQTMPVSEKVVSYIYRNETYGFDSAFMVTGVSLKDLLIEEGYTSFKSVDIDGLSVSGNGVLKGSYFLTRNNGSVVLATSDKNRLSWPVVHSITVS